MFIPLYDTNGLKYIKRQYVTLALIAVNAAVYFLSAAGGDESLRAASFGFGFVPALVNDAVNLPPGLAHAPETATYLTYSFLHGDLIHLGGNMLFLWVFGDNVEDALGHLRYLVFYLACAAAGAFAHAFFAPWSEYPLIGASGAIAGVVAAYLILHPRVKLWVLVLMRIPLRIPAFIPLIVWVGMQFVMLALGGDNQISFAAHAGGIVAGAVLVLFMRRSGVPLFDRAVVTPKAVRLDNASAVQPVEAAPAPRWGRQ